MTQTSRYSLSNNLECTLALVLIVFTAISIRMAEYLLWLDPALFVGGEHLMATHDAYTWLAGAKDIGNYANHHFAQLLALLHSLTGLDLAALGFWSPIILVPLLAVPVALFARSLGLAEGALVFGILTTSGLGYLVRTRLGFCDTDLISLIFPLSVTCLVAAGLATGRQGRDGGGFLSRQELLGAVAAGLLGKIAVASYPSNATLLFVTCAMALVLGVFLVPKARREAMASGVLLVFALTFAGWDGAFVAGLWIAWTMRRPAAFPAVANWLFFAAAAGGVLYLGNAQDVLWLMAQKLFFYAKTSAPDLSNATAAVKLPEIAQSVREAQSLDWALLGPRLGGNWVVFILGMAGFGFVCWRRPALLMFLPFLALGFASVKLGNRFSMYGTVGIGMGLGLGLSELMLLLKQSQGRRWIAQLSMACVALWPSADFMQEVGPVPVLPQTYAQAFLDLRETTEPDALLWQWWDYGYAGQYYAERATFGDGSRQSGPWLYPLARVHCATSPREAAQLMRYFGQVMLESGSVNNTDARTALFKGNPVAEIQKMDAESARQFVSDLAQGVTVPSTVPNYFVVSWENLRLAGWIGFYGNWDIITGTSSSGKMQQVRGEVRIDSSSGSLMVNGQPTPVDSLDVVEEKGARHFEWQNGSGSHVLINQAARQVFLMDQKMYRSMMVQMLIAPPGNFAEDFTLVIDRYPWVRAYKVKG